VLLTYERRAGLARRRTLGAAHRADGWQQVQLSDVESDLLWLTEPLARAARGQHRAAAGVGQAPSILPISPSGCRAWSAATWWPRSNLRHRPMPDVLDDPWLDEMPVWPDGNWRDDPTAVAQATITRQDFSPADPWVRRDDPWATTTLQRRYLASTR
jgi:hypothetical protein